MWAFEGNLEADMAPGENEFDTPALEDTPSSALSDTFAPYLALPNSALQISLRNRNHGTRRMTSP